MAEQVSRISSSRRTALKNIVRLIPAVVIMAATLNTLSCGSGGLLTPVDSGSTTPTSTPTTGTGALAFVTNFNDGKVSSFKRNTTTGVLTHSGQVLVGAKKGPRGVVAAPSGSFLYVANLGDDNIYEFSINSTNGTLTPLSPASISNGSGTGPDQLAINSAGHVAVGDGPDKGTRYRLRDKPARDSSRRTARSAGSRHSIRHRGAFVALGAVRDGYRDRACLVAVVQQQTECLPEGYGDDQSDVAAVTPGLVVMDSAGAALFTADQKTPRFRPSRSLPAPAHSHLSRRSRTATSTTRRWESESR